jgi:cell division protein FtsB
VSQVFDSPANRFPWRLLSLLLKAAACLLVGGALTIYLNFQTLQDYFRTRERRDEYRAAVSSLKREYDALLDEQAALKNNGFAKEKAIRERLLMVRPREQILFVEPPGEREQPQPQDTAPSDAPPAPAN